MSSLNLGIKVVSAEGLTNEMNNVYVMVTLKGGAFSDQKAQTEVDKEGGKNPRWNSDLMKFTVDRSLLTEALNSHLTFTVVSQNHLGDKNIGEIKVSIAELIQSAGQGRSMENVSYPVKESSGLTTNGKFNFAYKFIAPQAQAQAPPHVQQTQAPAAREAGTNKHKYLLHVHHRHKHLSQQAQATLVRDNKTLVAPPTASIGKDGKLRDIGTKVVVGLGVTTVGGYMARKLSNDEEAAASGSKTAADLQENSAVDPKTSYDDLNSSSFYEQDGLSGNEIFYFVDTSAIDPTASLDDAFSSGNENLFGDEAGLSGSDIAAFLDTSTINPTTSGIATAAFSDTSVTESTDSFDVGDFLLNMIEKVSSFM